MKLFLIAPQNCPPNAKPVQLNFFFFRSFLPVIRNLNWHYAISDEMTNDAI